MSHPVDIHALANGLLYGNATDVIENRFEEISPTPWGYYLPPSLRQGSFRDFLDALASVCVSTAGKRGKAAVTLTENDDAVILHIAHTEHASRETLVAFVHNTWAALQHISDACSDDTMACYIDGDVVLPSHENYSDASVQLLTFIYRHCRPKIIAHIEKGWENFRTICSQKRQSKVLARASKRLTRIKSLMGCSDLGRLDNHVAAEVFRLMYELQTLCSSSSGNLPEVVKLSAGQAEASTTSLFVKMLLVFLIMNLWCFAKSPLEHTRHLFTKELRIEYLVSPDRAIQYPSDAVWDKYLTYIFSEEGRWIFPSCKGEVIQSAKNAVAVRNPVRVHPECLLLAHHHDRLRNDAAGIFRAPLENYVGCSKQRACYMRAQFFSAYRCDAPPFAPRFETRMSLYRFEGPWAMPEIGDAELKLKILDGLYRRLCRDLILSLYRRGIGGSHRGQESSTTHYETIRKRIRDEQNEESDRRYRFLVQEGRFRTSRTSERVGKSGKSGKAHGVGRFSWGIQWGHPMGPLVARLRRFFSSPVKLEFIRGSKK
ncbi:hypothetical protein BOTBODRAFT_185775 [Botryobasidium botryosum FD-172 SS1]|uniref:Uncharacterized protein n=1 Tax=Botryobasidium botryosum (strain FD-172 SS1) TaxID=930990 RepID=A0A067N1K2_BOTB1|nr:hypothetical protein BOTBODRAFT_185775 [Botryobasidium botryosum FD-172 SS1]